MSFGRVLHGVFRRYWAAVERLIVAALLAGAALLVMLSLPAFPAPWELVITGAIFGATLASPALGYFLAVAAVAYPLYTLSIYLLALFLAPALLGQRLFINNLGGTLLTLASPLLSALYLPWLVPLMGGLWWGPWGGALMGGLSAAWGIILAGMTETPPDWLARLGTYPDLAVIAGRFGGADSLDTLWLLAEPLAPDSTTLLRYVLQVALWAGVGALVGTLAEKPWAQRRQVLAGSLLGWLGALLLLAGHVLIGLWLAAYPPETLRAFWQPLALAVALPAAVVMLLEGLHNLVEYPLAWPGRSSRLARSPGSFSQAAQARAAAAGRAAPAPAPKPGSRLSAFLRTRTGITAAAVPPVIPPAAPLSPKPGDAASDPPDDEPDDLIMLELD